jgi:tetratricopeptide (TPR) repeat protein
LSEQSTMPYLRVAALACAGLAKGTVGDFAGAAHDLREAIDFGRQSRAGLEYEGRMLADLAEMLYRAGNLDDALEVSKEALAVAKRRTDRMGECHASLMLGIILTAGGNGDEEVVRLLEQAESLLSISGAAFFQPHLAKLQSQLEGYD